MSTLIDSYAPTAYKTNGHLGHRMINPKEIHETREISKYVDKEFLGTDEEYRKLMEETSTIYVGKLAGTVTEERIYALFSVFGEISRVVMGIHRNLLKPCGFAFVEYTERKFALNAAKLARSYCLDSHEIAVNMDHGYSVGRELGRGSAGGQRVADYKKVRYTNQQ